MFPIANREGNNMTQGRAQVALQPVARRAGGDAELVLLDVVHEDA